MCDGSVFVGGSIDILGFYGVPEAGSQDSVVLGKFGVYELSSCTTVNETLGVDVSVFVGDVDRDVHAYVTSFSYQHGLDAQWWRDSW